MQSLCKLKYKVRGKVREGGLCSISIVGEGKVNLMEGKTGLEKVR